LSSCGFHLRHGNARGGPAQHSGRGRGNTGSAKNFDIADGEVRKGSSAYQSSSVGAVNAEQSDGGADILGRGGICAQAVEGRAGDGELLGGAQAGAGDTSGHHRGIDCEESLGREEGSW
jgi:hypothetical protein